jgi:MscS family membrane protein
MDKARKKEIRLKFFNVAAVATLVALVIFTSILLSHEYDLFSLPETARILLLRLSVVIGTLFTVSVGLRITVRSVYRFFDEPEESIFYSKIYSWVLYGIAVFVILAYLGVSLGNITLVIGLMATGLAFAVRDVLMSFFGWMVLLRKKPFRIGDYIRIGEDEGRVQHIGTFFVLLANTISTNEQFTRVPNRLFLEKSITKKGKETITDHISIPLKGLPANKAERIEVLRSQLESIIAPVENIRIYSDIRNDKLCLVVEFPTNISRQAQTRSVITDQLFEQFGDYISVLQA